MLVAHAAPMIGATGTLAPFETAPRADGARFVAGEGRVTRNAFGRAGGLARVDGRAAPRGEGGEEHPERAARHEGEEVRIHGRPITPP